MDYLWTPWRYQYLVAPGKQDGCVFCRAAEETDDRRTLVVHRAVHNFVILNRFPYTNGHLMIVPYEHVASLGNLDAATLAEMMLLAQAAEGHLRTLYRPDGLNFGVNLGASAGAGIAGHLHLHGLPRWMGDANFMTVIGETRILPEELDVSWQRLSDAFRGAGLPGAASK
jgi:ATP adenylyltransferase